MSRDQTQSFAERFESALLAELDDDPFSGAMPKLARHAALLHEASERFNLTSLREPEDLAKTLYAPAIRVSGLLHWRKGQSVLDLGSGGGFPGVPLAILRPECRFTLLEATRKKAEFLEGAVRDLDLTNARALWGRGESFLKDRPQDLVLAQAVSPSRELLSLLASVRASIGTLALMKGPHWEKEIAEGEERSFGFERIDVRNYSLGKGRGNGFLVLYRATDRAVK